MVFDLIEAIGFVAGVCTSVSFVPQVYKTWNTKSVKDISFLMYAVLCTGVSLWIIYGLIIGSLSVICSNIVTFILAVSMILMKLRYRLS